MGRGGQPPRPGVFDILLPSEAVGYAYSTLEPATTRLSDNHQQPIVEAQNPQGDVGAEPDQKRSPALEQQEDKRVMSASVVPDLDLGDIILGHVTPPPSAVIIPRTTMNVCPQLQLVPGGGHPWLTFNANRLYLTGPDHRVALSDSAVPAREIRAVAEQAIATMIQRGTLPMWVKPAGQHEAKDLEHKTPRMSDEEWESTIARHQMVQVHLHGKSYFCSPVGYILDCANRTTVHPRIRGAIRQQAQVALANAQVAEASVTSESCQPTPRSDASPSSGHTEHDQPDESEPDDPDQDPAPPAPVNDPELDRCTICLNPLIGHYPVVRALPCGHRYHGVCIDIADPPLTRCPMCRAEIVPQPMAEPPLAEPAIPDEPAAPVAAGRGGPVLVNVPFWVSRATIAAARHIGVVLVPGDRTHPHPIHSASRACILQRLCRDYGRLYTVGLNPEHIGGLNIVPNTNGRYSQDFHGLYAGPTCQHAPDDACECHLERTIVHFNKPELSLDVSARLALLRPDAAFYVVDNEIWSARQELGAPDKDAVELENDDHPQRTEGLLYVTGRGNVVVKDLGTNDQYVYPFPKWQITHFYEDALGNQFRVSVVTHMKNLTVWRFRFDPRPHIDVPPVFRDMTAVALDRTYVGPLRMAFSQDSPESNVHIRGDPQEVDVYCAQDYLVADTEDPMGVFIPKAILSNAMAQIAYMPRGPQVTAAVRSLITRELRPYGLSTVETLKSVTMMVPLALSGNVLNEMGAWQVSVEPLLPAMERARSMLNYVPRSLTSLLTTPTFERSYARLRACANSAGSYISRYPYQIVVLGSLLTLVVASLTLSLLGPGEKLPPTRTVSSAAWHWWSGAQDIIVSYGSQAYAMTFPECSVYWFRRLGLEPPCRSYVNGEVVVVETLRNAWFYRAALHTGAVWLFFGWIFFEETIKRLGVSGQRDAGLLTLIAVETLSKFANHGVTALIAAPTVAAMHYYWRHQPFWKAVTLHMMWNMTVAVFELYSFSATIGPAAASLIAVYTAWHLSFFWPMGGHGPVVLGPRYEVIQARGPIDTGARITFATRTKPHNPEAPALAQMGPIVPGAIPCVPATTSVNLYSALRDRHLLPKQPVVFTQGQLNRSVDYAMDMLLLPTSYKRHDDATTFWPQKFASWLAKHTASQRAFLDRAIEHLKLVPYRTGFSKHHRCFTKREKLLKHKPMPRLVLTVSPEFAVTAGPFLWSVAKWIKEHWHMKPVFYCPGATVEAISAWFQWHADRGYRFLEEDMSRCDSSYWAKLLKATARLYRAFFVKPRVKKAIHKQYDKCVLHGNDGTEAEVNGTLCTGSHETTIGNTKNIILNKLAAWIPHFLQATMAYYNKYELSNTHAHPLGIMQAGDDGLNAVHPQFDVDPARLVAFGYRAVSKWTTPEKATFLSGRFYKVGLKYVWGPKAGRQIAKLGIDIEFDPNPVAKMRGVAMGLRNLTAHIPLLGVLVVRILNLTEGTHAKPIFEDWKPMAANCYSPTDETYDHFAHVYETTRAEIADCEQYLSQVSLTSFLYHPLIEKVIAIDAL